MLFVSLLQRMGFPSDPRSAPSKEASLQSRPKSDGRHTKRLAAASAEITQMEGQCNRGITTDQPVAGRRKRTEAEALNEDARHHEQSGIERRFLVKAPAKSTAKPKSAAPAAGKGRSAVASSPAKPVAKKVSTVAVKAPATKAASSAKKTAPVKAIPVKPSASKPAPVKAAPAKPTPAPKSKPTAGAKAAASVSVPKTATQSTVKSKPAPVSTTETAKPVPPKAAPAPRVSARRASAQAAAAPQAASLPTHAPNAAKATFSQSNERVMTPPATPTLQKDPKRANNWKNLPVEQLTDLDIQAMPESEYMNDVQMAYFRRKLNLLKEDMLANAGETTEHLREDTVVVPDPADRATIEEEHALELRTRDRERKLLKKIGQAIARIDAGDYGYCEETGEPIGVARLMARPTASLSLEAQQRRELKQKMFGD